MYESVLENCSTHDQTRYLVSTHITSASQSWSALAFPESTGSQAAMRASRSDDSLPGKRMLFENNQLAAALLLCLIVSIRCESIFEGFRPE